LLGTGDIPAKNYLNKNGIEEIQNFGFVTSIKE